MSILCKSYAHTYASKKSVDLNCILSENPYGSSPLVAHSIAQSLEMIHRYPYEEEVSISQLARHHRINPKNIMSYALIYFCNPNNPTGEWISLEEMLHLADRSKIAFLISESSAHYVGERLMNKDIHNKLRNETHDSLLPLNKELTQMTLGAILCQGQSLYLVQDHNICLGIGLSAPRKQLEQEISLSDKKERKEITRAQQTLSRGLPIDPIKMLLASKALRKSRNIKIYVKVGITQPEKPGSPYGSYDSVDTRFLEGKVWNKSQPSYTKKEKDKRQDMVTMFESLEKNHEIKIINLPIKSSQQAVIDTLSQLHLESNH